MRKSILLLLLVLKAGTCLLGQDAKPEPAGDYLEKFYGKPLIIAASYQEVCTKLGIPYDGHTADSFSLRLWSASMMGFELLTIYINADQVEARQFQYHTIDNFHEKPVSFKTSPGQLLLELEKLVFNELISQEFIPGFRRMADDGVSYFLEAVSEDDYNAYYYDNPCSYIDPDNILFCSIINLLRSHIRDIPGF